VRPGLPNADLGIVSDDIFHLPELPRSMLIVGGGYIACEFAGILNGLGVEVTQYYRGAQILRGFDDEARGLIAEQMHERGVDLHVGTNILEMRRATEDEAAGKVDLAMGQPWTMWRWRRPRHRQRHDGADLGQGHQPAGSRSSTLVLFATGRDPNTADMGLEDVGVTLGRRGEVLWMPTARRRCRRSMPSAT
jgi:glutathione reductase (NADPH)